MQVESQKKMEKAVRPSEILTQPRAPQLMEPGNAGDYPQSLCLELKPNSLKQLDR